MISIQCQECYDAEERYSPSVARWGSPTLNLIGNATAYRLKMSVDNFQFTKQLLATSGTDTTRCIEPRFLERPFTTNFQQLQNDSRMNAKFACEFDELEYDNLENQILLYCLHRCSNWTIIDSKKK